MSLMRHHMFEDTYILVSCVLTLVCILVASWFFSSKSTSTQNNCSNSDQSFDKIRFKRYVKMENLETISGLRVGTWVATEKVHGANFSFISDGTKVQCGKRSGELDRFAKFYKNWYPAAEARFEKVLKTFKAVKALHPETRTIHIYCEFFGGHYPHPEVEKIQGVQYVQKGLWYCPHYEFYCFDLCVNGKHLPFEKMHQILKDQGWLVAEPLCQGSFEEVSQFDVESFKTTIPSRLNLPPLAETQFAEGVVLRGLTKGRIKKKTLLFREHGKRTGKKKAGQPKKKNEKSVVINEEDSQLIDTAVSYVTEVRFDCVISKIGRDAAMGMNPNRLKGLLLKDASNDWREDYKDEIKKTWGDKRAPTALHKMMQRRATEIVALWLGDP